MGEARACGLLEGEGDGRIGELELGIARLSLGGPLAEQFCLERDRAVKVWHVQAEVKGV